MARKCEKASASERLAATRQRNSINVLLNFKFLMYRLIQLMYSLTFPSQPRPLLLSPPLATLRYINIIYLEFRYYSESFLLFSFQFPRIFRSVSRMVIITTYLPTYLPIIFPFNDRAVPHTSIHLFFICFSPKQMDTNKMMCGNKMRVRDQSNEVIACLTVLFHSLANL